MSRNTVASRKLSHLQHLFDSDRAFDPMCLVYLDKCEHSNSSEHVCGSHVGGE